MEIDPILLLTAFASGYLVSHWQCRHHLLINLSRCSMVPLNLRIVLPYQYNIQQAPRKYATPEHEVKQAIEDFKLPFGDEQNLNKAGKKQHNNDALMIVSDMLLTGYDVPIAMVMYLDKPLKAHNLLQAIARVNRTRSSKPAGIIVDYCGISNHLVDALKIFSGDLQPQDVMVNISEEITKLKLRHNRLVAFFQDMRIDRKKQRQAYVDAAVQFLEPIDIRDKFKELLKKFNVSLNIVLPDESALEYKDDFTLFNEIKLQAGNTYLDKSLKVSKDESKKLQTLHELCHIKHKDHSKGFYQELGKFMPDWKELDGRLCGMRF